MPRVSLAAAVEDVARRDATMRRFIKRAGPMELRASRGLDVFSALASSILYQQLAGKAAAAIHARFLALFDGRPTPEAILDMSAERLRGVGLSGNKAAAISDLASKVIDGTVPTDGWSKL